MNTTVPTSQEKVDLYNKARAVFDGLISEVREISKKKPDATLSAYKVRIINRALADLQQLLDEAPERSYLDLLDDEQLPQFSDAVMVMVQYEAALNSFHSRHYGWHPGLHEHVWNV